jgi:myo-inositol-1(or 4)-monophosphatase
MESLWSYFPFVTELNRSAGEIVRRYFGSDLPIDRKADSSPVTRADREVEALLRERIERRFPDHSVFGEEFGETKKKNQFRWIIDPIDGTQSFILGVPLFGTLIALEFNGEPVLGSIYLPIQDQLMIGSAETGTFLEGERCQVSHTERLSDAKILTTDPRAICEGITGDRLGRLCRQASLVRGFGDCYGYFMVASGKADVMLDPIINYYDIAPMFPIMAGAGGSFTTWDGARVKGGGNALACNSNLHGAVLEALGPSV